MWDWRDTSTPKVAGGRDDQPAGLLRKAKYLEAVYRLMRRWYAGDTRQEPAEQELFALVLRLRKEAKSHADTR